MSDARGAAYAAQKNERRERVEEFQRIYILQKIWLAKLYARIQTIIHEDPEKCSSHKMYEALKRYAHLGAFTPLHLAYIQPLIELYWIKRHAVSDMRTVYRDDAILYEAVFGVAPHSHVQVIEGPVTLYFRCDDLRDYARIRFEYFYPSAQVTADELAIADKSGGVSIPSAPIRYRNLEGTLIAEKALSKPFGGAAQNIYRHEEQHVFFRFVTRKNYPPAWKKFIPKASVPLLPFEEESYVGDREHAKQLFLRYLRRERFEGEESSKNELLAYAVGGTNRHAVIKYLLTKEEDGGLYDYFKGYHKKIQRDLLFYGWVPKSFDALFERVFEREYEKLLEQGCDAIDLLGRNGFLIHEIVGLLMTEPLRFWLKIARRICPKDRTK